MKKVKLSELAFLALCCTFGFVIKGFVSPVTNILTDFIKIPGGSAAGGFSMMFLALGSALVPKPGAAAMMGAVQAFLAIILGMTGFQGMFCIITYLLPGVVVDIVTKIYKKSDLIFFIMACCLSNLTGSIVSAVLVFKFNAFALALWLAVSLGSGIVCALLGNVIYGKLKWMNTYLKVREIK